MKLHMSTENHMTNGTKRLGTCYVNNDAVFARRRNQENTEFYFDLVNNMNLFTVR